MNGRVQFRLRLYIRSFGTKLAAMHFNPYASRCDSLCIYSRSLRLAVANSSALTVPTFPLTHIFHFQSPGPNPAVNTDAPSAALRAGRGSPVTLVR